jgi:hypothetical protein
MQAGWEYGGPIAGHLIGVFPHEKIPGDKITLNAIPAITTECERRMLRAGSGIGYWRFTS